MVKTRLLTLAAMIALVGCGPAATTIPPSAAPTLMPTVPPTPEPTAKPSCPELAEGTQLLTQENVGYCLMYPEGFLEVYSDPAQVCLVPEGPTMGCHTAVAFFNVNDAAGRSVDQIADEMIADSEAEIPGIAIQRTSSTVSGQLAVALEGLPGVTSTRDILIVYADRLYWLTFILPGADSASVEQFERLYTTVIDSFTFLPVGP